MKYTNSTWLQLTSIAILEVIYYGKEVLNIGVPNNLLDSPNALIFCPLNSLYRVINPVQTQWDSFLLFWIKIHERYQVFSLLRMKIKSSKDKIKG